MFHVHRQSEASDFNSIATSRQRSSHSLDQSLSTALEKSNGHFDGFSVALQERETSLCQSMDDVRIFSQGTRRACRCLGVPLSVGCKEAEKEHHFGIPKKDAPKWLPVGMPAPKYAASDKGLFALWRPFPSIKREDYPFETQSKKPGK